MDLLERRTCWGAPSDHPATAVALLRAHASRAGVALHAVSPAVAAAAVIAAEAWWTALGATSFNHPRRHGDAALAAFAAIVGHAAGRPVEHVAHMVVDGCGPAPDAWFVAASTWAEWLAGQDLERDVFADAASLLAAGAGDARLATMTSVLLAAADTV